MKQQRFRIGRELLTAVLIFIKAVCRHLARLGVPAVARIPNDAEEPAAAVHSLKGREVPKRPQRGLLHNIFRVVVVSDKPAGKSIRGLEVRKDDILEAG